MANHIVHSYDKELDLLAKSIIDMSNLVINIINIANNAVKDPKDSSLLEAQEIDKKINALDILIEEKSTSIIALRQPMAIDLRLAISALKIAVIMERMGDICKNITNRSLKLSKKVHPEYIDIIQNMSNKVILMLKDAMEAFLKSDSLKAKEVFNSDNELDSLYGMIIDRLQADMISDSSCVENNMQLILISKNIERLGDYAAKIASIIHYIATGNRKVN